MLTFLSADLITGEIRDELPLTIDSDLSRFIGDVGEGTLSLPIRDPACPADWVDHTRPWRTLVVAVDERGQVVWAGIPNRRVRDPLEPIVGIPCITLEGYLDRRYVPDLDFIAEDQAMIAQRLARVAGDGTGGINLEYDTPYTGVHRDRHYLDAENATVLDRMTELAEVINALEWTIDVEWANGSQTRFAKVFRTGHPHIGRVRDTPNAIFELPGGIIEAELDESWSDSDAATHVIAIGEGEADDITISNPVIDTARESAGWPRLEHRRNFQSVTRQDTINAHAQAVAGELFGGQEIVTVQVRTDMPPEFGSEWNLGDSVGVRIDTDTVHLDQVWRVVGWKLRDAERSVEPVIARTAGQG